MTTASQTDRAQAVRERYLTTFGAVPAGIEQRLRVAEATGRLAAIEAIEQMRRAVLAENTLGPRVQQLVHFGQLLALGRSGPARLHARGALRGGADLADLVGVAETALVTAGMPAYALGIEIIAELVEAGENGGTGDGDGGG